MHYTIYFNQKPLLLTESKTAAKERLKQTGTAFQDQPNDASIRDMFQQMEEPATTGGVLLFTSAEQVLQKVKQNTTVIEAAGGLVHTDKEEVLMIYRNGKWDLPKGKLEEDETAATAAVREVQEETGLQHLQLEEPLTTTYHTYYQYGKLILKESHWFLMKSLQQQTMVPQVEEGIEKCEWVKLNALVPYFENTHPSIIDVLELGIKKIPQF